MKYTISESRLEEIITNYLDELFDVDNINYVAPLEYDEDTGAEWDDENRYEFYIGDYGDGETCFKWYDCEYFNEGSPAKEICPTVVLESPYDERLNGYFGDAWQELFKKWFYENFDLPVKTVEYF